MSDSDYDSDNIYYPSDYRERYTRMGAGASSGGMDATEMKNQLQEAFGRKFQNIQDDDDDEDSNNGDWGVDEEQILMIPIDDLIIDIKQCFESIINDNNEVVDTLTPQEHPGEIRNNKKKLLDDFINENNVHNNQYSWEELNDAILSTDVEVLDRLKKLAKELVGSSKSKSKRVGDLNYNDKLLIFLSITGPLDNVNIEKVKYSDNYFSKGLLRDSFNFIGLSLIASPASEHPYGTPAQATKTQMVPTDDETITAPASVPAAVPPAPPLNFDEPLQSRISMANRIKQIIGTFKDSIDAETFDIFVNNTIQQKRIALRHYVDRKVTESIARGPDNNQYFKVDKNIKNKPQNIGSNVDKINDKNISEFLTGAKADKVGRPPKKPVESQPINLEPIDNRNELFEMMAKDNPMYQAVLTEGNSRSSADDAAIELAQTQEEMDILENTFMMLEQMNEDEISAVNLSNSEKEKLNVVVEKINSNEIPVSDKQAGVLNELINKNNLESMKTELAKPINDDGDGKPPSNLDIIKAFIIPPAPPMNMSKSKSGKNKSGKIAKQTEKKANFAKNQALLDKLLSPVLSRVSQSTKQSGQSGQNGQNGQSSITQNAAINIPILQNQAQVFGNAAIPQTPRLANSTSLIIIKLLTPYVKNRDILIRLGAASSILQAGRYNEDENNAIDDYLKYVIGLQINKYSGKLSPNAAIKKEYLVSMLDVLNNKNNPNGTARLFKPQNYIRATKFSPFKPKNNKIDYLKQIELNTRKAQVTQKAINKQNAVKETAVRARRQRGTKPRTPSKKVQQQLARNSRIRAAYDKLKSLTTQDNSLAAIQTRQAQVKQMANSPSPGSTAAIPQPTI